MNVRSTQSQSDLYMFICLRNLVVGVQLHHDQFEDLQNGTVVLVRKPIHDLLSVQGLLD